MWDLNAINNNSCSNVKMTIIACNAWKWENSIWEKMSNQLWISTEAANTYIWLWRWKEEFSWLSAAKYISTPWKPTIYNYASISILPIDIIKEWTKAEFPKWKIFTPNY